MTEKKRVQPLPTIEAVTATVERWLFRVDDPGARTVQLSYADKDTLFALHSMLCELEVARRRDHDYRERKLREERDRRQRR